MLKNGLAHARVWHLVDAKDKVLGRVAQRISIALRGKHKPTFNPEEDCGDFVVVINAKSVVLTGNKAKSKEYHSHSGYPGGHKAITYDRLLEKDYQEPLRQAVLGMMPKHNTLRKAQISRLKIFPDDRHPFEANILKSYE